MVNLVKRVPNLLKLKSNRGDKLVCYLLELELNGGDKLAGDVGGSLTFSNSSLMGEINLLEM